MQTLTIWQPWAQLLAIGAKEYETRGWPTKYRGPIAIHAGARWLASEASLCWRKPFVDALDAAGIGPPGPLPVGRKFPKFLPLGAVIAVAELVDCVPAWPRREGVGDVELAMGDWGPNRFGFRLANPVLLPEPVPCLGKQGMFVLPPAALKAVEAQLAGVGA